MIEFRVVIDKKASQPSSYVFIDASNLFYGGVKELGWKIDYLKLINFLKEKFGATKIFYYAGVRLFGFPFDQIKEDSIDPLQLSLFLQDKMKLVAQNKQVALLKQVKQVKFFLKLQQFGYLLKLKPVREIRSGRKIVLKANCDVDLTFDALLFLKKYKRVLVLSGDGDFLPLLKFLKKEKEKLWVIARSNRTAGEVKKLVKNQFIDLISLKEALKI